MTPRLLPRIGPEWRAGVRRRAAGPRAAKALLHTERTATGGAGTGGCVVFVRCAQPAKIINAHASTTASRAGNTATARLKAHFGFGWHSADQTEDFTRHPDSLVCTQVGYYRNARTFSQGTLLALSPQYALEVRSVPQKNERGFSAAKPSSRARSFARRAARWSARARRAATSAARA